MKLPGPILLIDLETTGIDPLQYSICELAAVWLSPTLEVQTTYTSLVKPLEISRCVDSMSVHDITEEELNTAPSLTKVLEKLEEKTPDIRDYVVGSWGSTFDIPFLKCQYYKVGRTFPFTYLTFDMRSVAVWELSKKDKASWRGIEKALSMLNLPFDGTKHRAMDDVLNAVKILKTLSVS